MCAPAGMVDTAFLRSDELPGGVALGYLAPEPALRTNVLHLPVRGNGDGGAYTTAADVHALWAAFDAGRIVDERWVAEMQRDRADGPPGSVGYGLGFWLPDGRRGRAARGHGRRVLVPQRAPHVAGGHLHRARQHHRWCLAVLRAIASHL